MHEPGGNCNDLMKKTVDALSSKELQQLFVSTQQNNLDICVEYGIKGWGGMICRIYHIDVIFRMMKATESGGGKYLRDKGDWANFIRIVLWYYVVYIWLGEPKPKRAFLSCRAGKEHFPTKKEYLSKGKSTLFFCRAKRRGALGCPQVLLNIFIYLVAIIS